MTKFKVGDRVLDKDNCICCNGTVQIIKSIENNSCKFIDRNDECTDMYKHLKKEKPMSLRSRIEALKNGWDKEADDILQEMGFTNKKEKHYYKIEVGTGAICIKYGKLGCGWDFMGKGETFEYNSQCEKLQAFKDALLWLLDKSGLEEHKKGDTIKIEEDGKIYKVEILEEL